MKISKHTHSCLLIEDNGKVFLLDPGNYTFDDKALDINKIPQLDYILYTHEHFDHFYLPFLKETLTKFPHAKIVTNKDIVEILAKEGISATSEPDEHITMQEVPHEKIWMGQAPLNVMITINNTLSSPGDSLTFDNSAKVLALPVQAPWGHTTWATETALKVKPKVIIPIHDWHWKDEVRKSIYERLEQFFTQHEITFLKAETGQVFEV